MSDETVQPTTAADEVVAPDINPEVPVTQPDADATAPADTTPVPSDHDRLVALERKVFGVSPDDDLDAPA